MASVPVGPSRHLTWEELACHDAARTPYPLIWRPSRAAVLAYEFEQIRALAGHRPLLVSSGYRTVAWNASVGGARWSEHVQGRALDLVPTWPTTVEELFREAVAQAKTDGSAIKFIRVYPGWVHIDTRPNLKLTIRDVR
jgi:hypothetical protein